MRTLSRWITKKSTPIRCMHPDGVALLVAAILAPTEPTDDRERFFSEVEHIRRQILRLADQYYKINACAFGKEE